MDKVIVFGMGNFYQINENKIKEKYEIFCYLDNCVGEKNLEYKKNIPVYNPRRINELDNYPVIIMVKQFVEPFYQMLDLGVDETKIIIGSLLFPETRREKLLLEYGKVRVVEKKLVYDFTSGESIFIANQQELNKLLKNLLREWYDQENEFIHFCAEMPLCPVSRDFGLERGEPIDRHYIEAFLETYKHDIRGDVLEVAENTYTLKYGVREKITSHVLHVNGWGKNTIKGNLETGEGLENRKFDTLIITQTLMFIYDLKSVASNIYKIMKNDAVALITVAGLSQVSRYDADNWGSFWGFHEDALKKLFIPLFGRGNVEVRAYGNVKTAAAMLYGLCSEELKREDFEVQDADYPVILAVRLCKRI